MIQVKIEEKWLHTRAESGMKTISAVEHGQDFTSFGNKLLV
jgi:hypothetical protein